MVETDTLATQIHKDTELYQTFEQFEEAGGYQSTSEALRAAMRQGLLEEETLEKQKRTRTQQLLGSSSVLWLSMSTLVLLLSLTATLPTLQALNASMLFLALAALTTWLSNNGADERLAELVGEATTETEVAS
jgi:Arc/MetJ-type ribon-helix-helix transcriptional regulator